MSETTTTTPSTTTTTSSGAPTGSSTPALVLPTSQSGYMARYVDIGINLTDKMYQGTYHGKKHHESDLEDVIQRAVKAGCKKMMVTGSDLNESKEAIRLAKKYPGIIYATCGVHPCSAKQFDSYPGGPDAYMSELEKVARQGIDDGTVVAFGEIGLDYDRFMFTPQAPQQKYFDAQLLLARTLNLPLFLHSRAAAADFSNSLLPHLPHLPGGLVHSFTGTLDEMQSLVSAGLYIGVNGCSLKTEENLAVVKEIPLDRIMLETDGPWCEIRKSHASHKYLAGAPELPKSKKKEKWERGFMVNSRNEPVAITHVAHAVAKLRGMAVEELCEVTWENSIRLFGLGEKASSK